MASCSFGTSIMKVLNLDYGRKRYGLLKQCGTRSWTSRKSLQYTNLVILQPSVEFLTACSGPSLKIQSVTRSEEDGSEEMKSFGLTSGLIPNLKEVEFLLTILCETSSISALELKLAGFHLQVTRDLTEKIKTPPSPFGTAVSVNTVTERPDSNRSVSTSSLAISNPVPSSGVIERFLDKAADEGFVIIQSLMVGFFRRSRTIKGKRGLPSCKEKQIVKEGQVVCYIDQLGCEWPIESDVTGEVIKILREDGDPVGYGDALIAVLPSFPGINLQ